MATRIYAVNQGEHSTDVRENVGPTATSAIIALVIDLATTPTKNDLMVALEEIRAYIMRDNSWPPA